MPHCDVGIGKPGSKQGSGSARRSNFTISLTDAVHPRNRLHESGIFTVDLRGAGHIGLETGWSSLRCWVAVIGTIRSCWGHAFDRAVLCDLRGQQLFVAARNKKSLLRHARWAKSDHFVDGIVRVVSTEDVRILCSTLGFFSRPGLRERLYSIDVIVAILTRLAVTVPKGLSVLTGSTICVLYLPESLYVLFFVSA